MIPITSYTDSFETFEKYEKQFLEAGLGLPQRQLWNEKDRQDVLSIVKKSLGIKEELIPKMNTKTVKTLEQDGFEISFLQSESWRNVVGTAHLYRPLNTDGKKVPFVLLCCGHGRFGKLNPGYQAMAGRLAKQGAMVLVPDNIGQGERIPMGHANVVLPFACGLSVQGLIVMETMAWLKWAASSLDIDTDKMAAIGNSGGGTLSMFLGALCPELSVLAPSGYPSYFSFIAQKEKKHCHCNILPGIVGKAEMWEVLGLFAPKPLYVSQGNEDNYFPVDLFGSVARKVKSVYRRFGEEENFQAKTFCAGHSWTNEKRYALGAYLSETLNLAPAQQMENDTLNCLDSSCTCLKEWPEDAATCDELAMYLTGLSTNPDLKLCDIYPSRYTQANPASDEHKQIFAQYEAFLGQI